MDKRKFEAKMKWHGQTAEDVAALIGCSTSTLSRKLSANAPDRCFDQDEIGALAEAWELTAEEILAIFFSPSVSSEEAGIPTG